MVTPSIKPWVKVDTHFPQSRVPHPGRPGTRLPDDVEKPSVISNGRSHTWLMEWTEGLKLNQKLSAHEEPRAQPRASW